MQFFRCLSILRRSVTGMRTYVQSTAVDSVSLHEFLGTVQPNHCTLHSKAAACVMEIFPWEKNGPCAPKTLASICMYNETAYPFAVIPYMDGDGHQIGGTFTSNSLKGILGAFSETLSCSAKNIPPLASMLSFFRKNIFI